MQAQGLLRRKGDEAVEAAAMVEAAVILKGSKRQHGISGAGSDGAHWKDVCGAAPDVPRTWNASFVARRAVQLVTGIGGIEAGK